MDIPLSHRGSHPHNDIIQLSGGWKVAKPFISVSEPIGLVSERTDTSLALLALRLSLPDFGQGPSRYAYPIVWHDAIYAYPIVSGRMLSVASCTMR